MSGLDGGVGCEERGSSGFQARAACCDSGLFSWSVSAKTENGENYQHDDDCTYDIYDIIHEVYLCLARNIHEVEVKTKIADGNL